jgi:acetyltransferase-like isoleucine patch superfamily enzyme
MVSMSPRLSAASYDAFLVVINLLLALPGHRLRRRVLRAAGVELGADVSVERAVRISCRRGVRLGDGCNINRGTYLDGRGGLDLGAHVNVSPGVVFLTASHDLDSPQFEGSLGAVRVGDRAWIATRAIVLPGTEIGEGAVVAAGAVVHGKVEPFSVVAGNPARQVRSRARDAQRSLPPYRRWFH